MSNWVVLLIIGLLSIVAGVMALANPFGASLMATAIAGWSFLILGILQVLQGLRVEGWGGKLWVILIGVFAVFLGVNLLGKPLEGMVTLTILVGVIFLASGIFKAVIGFALPGSGLKWAVLISGGVSILLGGMVLTNIPGSAVITLGALLGIELLSNGISAVSLALAPKDVETV